MCLFTFNLRHYDTADQPAGGFTVGSYDAGAEAVEAGVGGGGKPL